MEPLNHLVTTAVTIVIKAVTVTAIVYLFVGLSFIVVAFHMLWQRLIVTY